MKIINENLIELDVKAKDKVELIKELAKVIDKENRLNSYDEYVEEVIHRESLTTTGVGFGIAIPHGKCEAVKVPTVAFGRIKDGVDWNSLDGEPVYIVFLLAVPLESASNEHLKILAALSRKLLKDDFRESLMKIENKGELLELLEDVLKNVLK